MCVCVCAGKSIDEGGETHQSSVLCNTKAFREALLTMLHLKQKTLMNYTFFRTPLLPLD